MTVHEVEHGILKFRPRARLLYILGHELITDETTAITELAKNSYDADAQSVDVILTDIINKQVGSIEILDDGHGMDLEIIKKAWMEPARENKKYANGEPVRTKRFNRLPLGEKGVGRFSVDKLGLRLEITTRSCDFDPITKEAVNLSPTETVVVIEGKEFLENSYLDEIECKYWTRSPKKFSNNKYGTSLRISDLRADWSKELVQKLRINLARLSSPFDEAKDFKVNLASNNFPDLSSEINNPLLSLAPYTIDAKIDQEGFMSYTLNGIEKKKIDLKIGHGPFYISKGKYRNPVCGPFKFKLYAFDKEKTKLRALGMDEPKTGLLALLCGVSIYRDNFRVMPYGEQGNDWLHLDKRRVQSPGRVLGNDRVIGYVEISTKMNPQLRDKTNREGLIEEGKAFSDLSELAKRAADILGEIRYATQKREKRSVANAEDAKEEIDSGSKQIRVIYSRVISALTTAKNSLKENKIGDAVTAIDLAESEAQKTNEADLQINGGIKRLFEEFKLSQDQINHLIALSGMGLTAERLTHELSQSILNCEGVVQKAMGYLNLSKSHNPEISKNLVLAIQQLEGIRNILDEVEPLYYSKRREVELLNVGSLVRGMLILYSNAIKNLDLKIEISDDSELTVKMNPGQLMQVFNNLFENSFYWLKYSPPESQARIYIKVNAINKTVVFADNGPGIDEKIKPRLFEPFVSSKPDGRGLGLFIVQDILQTYKGQIDLETKNKILSGANFKITFKGD